METITSEENNLIDGKNVQKKRNPVAAFFKGVLIFILALLAIIAAFIGWSAVDRISPLKLIPDGFNFVVHTDSVYDALDPLVELKSFDMALSDSTMGAARNGLMQARDFFNSAHPVLKKVLAFRIDVGLYSETSADYLVCADLGWRSFATRPLSLLRSFINVKGLSYDSEGKYFEFTPEKGTPVYIKPVKNAVVVSSTRDLFIDSVSNFKERTPRNDVREITELPKTKTFRIVASSNQISESYISKFESLSFMSSLIKRDSYFAAEFKLTNDDADIVFSIPLADGDSVSGKVSEILSKPSTPSRILSCLTSETQYYTIFNLDTLENLKDACFEVLPDKNFPSIWSKAETASKMLLGMDLEELLFSWTGKEIAAFGIEGSSDPVFALEVTDEAKRRQVFEKLDKSILVRSNSALLVDGIRLPCLRLPDALQGLLGVFGVALPSPYYLVMNNFIYFSLSPQNLSDVFNHLKVGHVIGRNQNWKSVTDKNMTKSSVSLYYNLNRSLPFFLESGSAVAKHLSLYSIGRTDFSVGSGCITVHLKSSVVKEDDSKSIPGFPVKTGKTDDYNLMCDNPDKPTKLYWTEEDGIVKSLDLNSLEQKEFDAGCRCFLTVSGKHIWVVTIYGTVFLLDKNLVCDDKFPIETGASVASAGAVLGGNFIVSSSSGKVIAVESGASAYEIEIAPELNVRSSPAVCGNIAAVYNRGFEGEIYLLKIGRCINLDNPMLIDGIGFGSPSLSEFQGKLYTAFITQAGLFYLFKDGVLMENFPVDVKGVFYTNVVCLDNFWYALSNDGQLYRIGMDGSFMCVKLPGVDSAKEGLLTVCNLKERKGIYVSGDTNTLFGFSPNLELLLSYPVVGRGTPVFADANNDKIHDCLVLSVSREINGWRIK